MTIFISRDYNPATSGYVKVPFPSGNWGDNVTSRVYVWFMYELSIFLNKILGFTMVGQTAWNIDNDKIISLNVTAATNTVPITVTTASNHNLIDGYVVAISGATGNTGVNGTWKVAVVSSTKLQLIGSYGTGTYVAGSATLTSGFKYASGKVSDGYGAGINFGAGFLNEVSIPSSVRTVVAGDIGRILVLKSTKYPTRNSGLFKITGINTTSNRYIIDYRSTDTPPMEPVNSMDWWLYENEAVASSYLIKQPTINQSSPTSTNTTPVVLDTGTTYPHGFVSGQQVTVSGHSNTAINGTWTITQINASSFSLNGSTASGTGTGGNVYLAGYVGGAASPHSRVIYQSPHESGWQVRLAAEPHNSNLPLISIAVGYNGNSDGDFQSLDTNAISTHIAQYLNVNTAINTAYTNTQVGAGHISQPSRMTIIGDDGGQQVFVYTRATNFPTNNNGIITFGIPDNEPTPTPPNAKRLFCYGSAVVGDFGLIGLRTGKTSNVGMAWESSPEFAALTGWANLDGTSASNPMVSANAGDSPFTGSTELLPVEIWAGINTDIGLTNQTNPLFSYNQRFIGTHPLVRNGRTNFGNFTLSTEDVSLRTITAASNTSPIQITTGVTTGLSSGQQVTITGVLGNTAANGTFTITVIDGTNFTLNGSVGNGTFVGATTIAAGSNGVSLPQTTINVASTTGFPTSGVIFVTTAAGVQTVTYTGITGTTFTGCTGGTGTMSTGGAVTAGAVAGLPRWLHLQNGVYIKWNGAAGLTP